LAFASSITGWNYTESLSIATGRRKSLKFLAVLRIAGLLLLFAVLVPVHAATKIVRRQSPWPRRFLGAAAWIVGARPRVEGAKVQPHTLLVSNHVSWLDILVLGGATGCAFVSKDELGHPLIHWLADQNDTVYVKRTHRSGAKLQAIAIAKSLEADKPIVLFPEGTTGPGTHLLPFRSTLLEAASFAAETVAIRPLVLDYGNAAEEIGWWHEPGKANILRLLGPARPIGRSEGTHSKRASCHC
jgi:1-acyl-sn-glycerol-3-phosphate acyltransferase